jgi:hypothetical protein
MSQEGMQEPRREVEVRGGVGDAVALPLGAGPHAETDPAYAWSLELPEGVEQVGSDDALAVRADAPGSYVVVATQSDPAGVAMTVLPVRLTVA